MVAVKGQKRQSLIQKHQEAIKKYNDLDKYIDDLEQKIVQEVLKKLPILTKVEIETLSTEQTQELNNIIKNYLEERNLLNKEG